MNAWTGHESPDDEAAYDTFSLIVIVAVVLIVTVWGVVAAR